MNNPLNKWLPTLLCVVLVALSVCGQAQADKFIITGKFRIDGGSNSDAKIVLEKDGKKVRTVDGSSRFEIPLDYQAVYIISFEKEGYVTKRLRFDTHVPPERQEQGFFPFDFTVEIFEQFDDVNMVIFNQPVGKISYDELIDEFNYDTDYTQSIQTQIAQAMEEVEQKKVEKVEKQAEEKKQADALNKQLTSLTTAGDKKVSSGKLDDALKDYQEAVKLKDSPELQKKIADTQAKLEQQKEQQQKKTEFDQLVAEAEAALAGGDLENAKKLFGEANGVLGGDPKVQSQLAKIDQQLAEAQQNAAAFDKLKGEAASALKAGNLQEAIDKSDQALKIKPDAELEGVKTQALAKQEEEKAAVAAQAELDEEYNQLLARATKEADGKDLIAALATLEEAKKLKDTPEVQERIVANQAKLEEVKKAEEALAKAEAATIELLEAAEAALENNDVKLARAKAEEANELKAGVADAVLKQIDEREKIIAAQLAEEQESEEKYNSLIKEGDEFLAAGELDKAEESFQEAKSLFPDKPEAEQGLSQLAAKRKEQEQLEQEKLAAQQAEKAEEEAKRAEFEGLIGSAEAALGSGDFAEAKTLFAQAGEMFEDKRVEKGLKAAEDGIQQSENAALADAEKQEKFDNAFAAGQTALTAGDYDEALSQFELAKGVEDTPEVVAKISEVETKIDERQKEMAALKSQQEAEKAAANEAAEKDKEFNDLILKGDKAYEKDDLDQAQKDYEAALVIKNDPHAQEQLKQINEKKAEIEKALAAQAEEKAASKSAEEQDEQYDAAIKEADKLLAQNNLDGAEEKYNAAKSVKPEESYPDEKLSEIETLREAEKAKAEELAKQQALQQEQSQAETAEKEKEKAVGQAISEGDKLFQANRLEDAKTKFNDALAYGPSDVASKKIAQIDGLLKQRAENESKAKEAAQAISNGSRESNELTDIIIDEGEKQKEPSSPQIVENTNAKTAIEPTLVPEKSPAKVINGSPVIVGDERVGSKAKTSLAATLTEDDKYDGMMNQIEKQDVQMQVEQEQRQLKEKYPARKTVETEKVGNSTITYVYLNKGDFVTVFKKVEHNWGGVFYFIDERSTNQRFWEHETQ